MKNLLSSIRKSNANQKNPPTKQKDLIPGMNPKLQGLLKDKLKALLPTSIIKNKNDSTLKRSLQISTLIRKNGQKKKNKKKKDIKLIDPFLYLNLKYLNTLKNEWVLQSFEHIIKEDTNWPTLIKKVMNSRNHIRNQKQHENIFNSGVLIFLYLKLFTPKIRQIFFRSFRKGALEKKDDQQVVSFQRINGYYSIDTKCVEFLIKEPASKPILVQNVFLFWHLLESLKRNLSHLKTNIEQFTKIYLVKNLKPFYREYDAIFNIYLDYSKMKEKVTKSSEKFKNLKDDISRIIEDTEKLALNQCKGFDCLKPSAQNNIDFFCPHHCKTNFSKILEGYWRLFSLTGVESALKQLKNDLDLRKKVLIDLHRVKRNEKIITFEQFYESVRFLFDDRLKNFLNHSEWSVKGIRGNLSGSGVSRQGRGISIKEPKQSVIVNALNSQQLSNLNFKKTSKKIMIRDEGEKNMQTENPENGSNVFMGTQKQRLQIIFRKIFCYNHNLKFKELRLFEKILFGDQANKSLTRNQEKINKYYCLKLYSDLYIKFFRQLIREKIQKVEELHNKLESDREVSNKTLDLIQKELDQEEGLYNRFIENIRILREEVDLEFIEMERLRETTLQKEREIEQISFEPKEETSTSFLMRILNWKKIEYYSTAHGVNRKSASILFKLDEMRKFKIQNFNEIKRKIGDREGTDFENKIFDFSSFFEWLMLKLLRESEVKKSSAKNKINDFLEKHLGHLGNSLRSFSKKGNQNLAFLYNNWVYYNMQ